jgi:hypothetical protein
VAPSVGESSKCALYFSSPDADTLKTYYEHHISVNPKSRFDKPIFDYLSCVLAADKVFKDAEISSWFLASYKLDFDKKMETNAVGRSTIP